MAMKLRCRKYENGSSVLAVLGFMLLVGGIVWMAEAFNMETSVIAHGIGQVHNFDLAEKRQNGLLGSGVCVLLGGLFLGFGHVSSRRNESLSESRPCPHCAEPIRYEATLCKHCGQSVPRSLLPESLLEKSDSPLTNVFSDVTRFVAIIAMLVLLASVMILAK